ncbi:DMT family transporter [Azospirillum picis]|uniref:Drug/metabolite transporter (DMT)-like permease n=1 Tax=Azospirillum picis TaxID=488438 RepID=A0ABU0MQF1_9PROT|nr:DMT family transporter [Azospirillum picis]MBP2302003.1 drug/metabolite transporter (DMT)-like permease [Azospirillum picis]MDQ0535706.1 drug/metabolite transporter (DMT)-like permease [Azospirillum picis]
MERAPSPLSPAVPAPANPENPRLGILSMLAAMVLMTVMNALAKVLAEQYPLTEVTFFRNLFALLPAIAMIAAAGGRRCLRTEHRLGHLWRSVIGLASMILLFWSYHLMPLANAVAISYSAPLFLTALSVPLLGERVGAYRWGAVLVGFAGVLVMVQPGPDMVDRATLVALTAAVCYALAMIAMRQLGRTERPVTTVFYFTVISTLLSALALPFAWVTPDGRALGMMALMGLAGGGAQYFSTRAYALASAVVVGPFSYASLIWAALLGWLVWGDVPAPHVLAGAAVVIASGLLILLRETRRKGRHNDRRADPSARPAAGPARTA